MQNIKVAAIRAILKTLQWADRIAYEWAFVQPGGWRVKAAHKVADRVYLCRCRAEARWFMCC